METNSDLMPCEVQAVFINNKEVSDIKEALRHLFIQRTRFIKSQYLLNSIEQSHRSGELLEILSNKVRSILIRFEIENGDYKFTDDCGNKLDILGIHSGVFSNVLKLSSSEKIALRKNLESRLSRASSKFRSKLKIFTDDKLAKLLDATLPDDLCLNKSKVNVFKYYNQFVENVAIRNGLYEQTNNLLFKLVHLKYTTRNKHFSEQLHCLDTNVNEVNIQARLFQLKFEYLILSINNKTFVALPLLYEKLKEKERETSTQLNRLESQLMSYDHLNGSEFPAIVKEYIEIQSSMKHMEWILEELNVTK